MTAGARGDLDASALLRFRDQEQRSTLSVNEVSVRLSLAHMVPDTVRNVVIAPLLSHDLIVLHSHLQAILALSPRKKIAVTAVRAAGADGIVPNASVEATSHSAGNESFR